MIDLWRKLFKETEKILINDNDYIIHHYKPLSNHIRKFSQCTIIDVYKFLYQRHFGWGHLINDQSIDNVHKRLQQEFNEVNELEIFPELLFELLNENSNLGRVHLRPWKFKHNGTIEQLWLLMNNVNVDTASCLTTFLKEISELFPQFMGTSTILDDFIRSLINYINQSKEVSNLPLFHHSSLFRNCYHPSYRLVFKEDLLKYVEPL